MILLLLSVTVVGGALLVDRSRRCALLRVGASGGSARRAVRTSLEWWPRRGPTATLDDDAGVMEAIARALRSGASVHAALEEAARRDGPLAGQLRQVVGSAAGGRLAAVELRRSAADAPERLRPALRLLAVAIDHGGASADAISRAAAVVRSEQTLRADAQVQSTQARTSALAIVALPVIFVALSMLTAPTVPGFLFGRPLGWLVLGGGLVLDALGWWWMRRITRGALP